MELKDGTEDLSGEWFGRLYVMRPVERTKLGIMWYCLCKCGESKITLSVRLRGGAAKSCGCLRRDSARRAGKISVYKSRMNASDDFEYTNQRTREEISLEIEANAIYDSVDAEEVIERQRLLTSSFTPDIGY